MFRLIFLEHLVVNFSRIVTSSGVFCFFSSDGKTFLFFNDVLTCACWFMCANYSLIFKVVCPHVFRYWFVEPLHLRGRDSPGACGRDHVDIHRRVARSRQHSSASRANRVGVCGVCNDWRRHALGQDPFWTKQRSGVREAVVPLGLRREEHGRITSVPTSLTSYCRTGSSTTPIPRPLC